MRRAAFSEDARRRVAALFVEERLEDLYIEPLRPDAKAAPDDIYLAQVTGVAPKLNAAFLNLGAEKGFLIDAPPALAPGARLLVRILRSAEGGKDARATMRIEFTSDHLVLTPRAPGVNVSKKPSEAERVRLKAALEPLAAAGGFVIRAAAEGLAPEVLRQEAEGLIAQYAPLKDAAGPPRRLKAAPNVLERAAALWRGAETGDFSAHDLDSHVARLLSLRVELPGGWMMIEPTAALVAVDVNAGAARAETNRAAALRLSTELRLRGLGGAVVVDFAGDLGESDRAALAAALAAPHDSAWRPVGWGPLGLFEATRRKDRPALAAVMDELGGAL